MKLTVAICTWNRAALLQQTLETMTRVRVPAETDWEVLVVNNNCTDDTDQVTAAYASRLPLRRLWEPRPGKSNACNRAARAAAGEYILWTDDDVLVCPHWLIEYCRAFRARPQAAVFGGPIDPWFASQTPDWLRQVFSRVAVAYAAIDLGEKPLPLRGAALPFGANLAIRTVEQRQHLYDPTRGPLRDLGLRGEETAVIEAILGAGGEGWWVPGARVRHYIPPERQTVDYLRRYYRGYGQIFARQFSPAAPTWFGRPRWAWRQAVQAEIRFRLKRYFCPAQTWIDDFILANKTWGILQHKPGPAAPSAVGPVSVAVP